MNRRPTVKRSRDLPESLEQGRKSFQNHAWRDAYSQLSAADHEAPLGPEDLVQLAQAALLIGKDDEGSDFLARGHQAFLSCGDAEHAARCAFWLGFTALLSGESAKAGGWLSRASRLVESERDCAEKGYLLLPPAYRAFHEGDAGRALSMFAQATAVGERFRDKDLVTLGLQGQGRVLIRTGEVSRGLALLDEAMVAVTAGEISPLNAGGVYCSVLEACGEIFDLKRAQEWSLELEKWCASQPDMVPYRGHCLVRRAELLQLHGAWADALEKARQACELLSRPAPKAAFGAAFYQVGEIQRLRGSFRESEEAYRQASQWQRNPGPGLALLYLAQGQIQRAKAAIDRMSDEVQEPRPRARVLDAYVEIVLAGRDVISARGAVDELTRISTHQNIAFLHALASRAAGAVLLAEGNPKGALAEFRESWNIWSELEAPYETARVRLLMALAFRTLGDEENMLLELNAALQTFKSLGAAADLSRAEALLRHDTHKRSGPLTEREVQVLRLVASGLTNRAIAGKLRISEKTVARHLSNIFTKLDLSSRTAATAYAYDHKLI
jgi:ATP/maltotriose-dependent transcriptional regulator MalT